MSCAVFLHLHLANVCALYRFEAQLAAVKDRLDAAKTGSTRGLSLSDAASSGVNFGGAGPRIAKPLRGGGANESMVNGAGGPNIPALSGIQAQEANAAGGIGGKRSSWFFDRR